MPTSTSLPPNLRAIAKQLAGVVRYSMEGGERLENALDDLESKIVVTLADTDPAGPRSARTILAARAHVSKRAEMMEPMGASTTARLSTLMRAWDNADEVCEQKHDSGASEQTRYCAYWLTRIAALAQIWRSELAEAGSQKCA